LGDAEPASVCDKAIKIYITGKETCDWSPGTRYPCTRFGYEFGYEGAKPGTTIQCEVKKTDPMGRSETQQYAHKLDRPEGRVFHSTFRTYAPVDERIILSEVHNCSYESEMLATIEYIIYYEPGADDTADRPAYFEVPSACDAPYFPDAVAAGVLNSEAKRSAASEHVPMLSSQCLYSSRGTTPRSTGLVFKFMLSDMFNVAKVPGMQLRFNATFAAGGADLKEEMDGLGDKAFVFEKGGRTTLFVITGVGGRDDFAGRPTELIATYYLDWPELEADTRLAKLLPLAHEHVRLLKEQQQ
jgi:hypothetical protein